MMIPYEYCALRYFLMWGREEKELHDSLRKNGDVNAIRKSLKHFEVARNFTGLKDDSKVNLIIRSMNQIDSKDNLSSIQKVEQLAEQFKKHFNQYNLSAASKLFWLRHRRPFIIYDNQAVKALVELGNNFHKRSYDEYYKTWQLEYKKRHNEIKNASSRLNVIHDFFPGWHKNESSMLNTITKPWFLERVFDIYLWEHGGKS